MSRAFVSEAAEEAAAAIVPERPVTPGPNPVTQRGMEQIEQEIARLSAALVAAGPDDPARPKLARDLRYWRSRHMSAVIVPAGAGLPTEVAFGTRVTLRRAGREERYVIVGEDEADPKLGLLNSSSPLARMLTGAAEGDQIDPGGGRPAVTVVSIERG